MSKTEKDPQPASEQSTRIFANQTKVTVDTYKLTTAEMKKNVSYSKIPQIIMCDHVHIFHNYDSSGSKLIYPALVGGHTHELILVSPATARSEAKYKCGPPIVQKTIIDENTGKAKKVWERLRFDDHIHPEVHYEKSDTIEIRKANRDAAVLIGMEAAKTAPIPGIIG